MIPTLLQSQPYYPFTTRKKEGRKNHAQKLSTIYPDIALMKT
jgi:hypothetical protein